MDSVQYYSESLLLHFDACARVVCKCNTFPGRSIIVDTIISLGFSRTVYNVTPHLGYFFRVLGFENVVQHAGIV